MTPPRQEPGWVGAFTRDQAPGAFANGSRVVKKDSEKGDGHADGAPGVVLGSISHPEVANGAILYFVEWANAPRCAVAIVDWKLRHVPT